MFSDDDVLTPHAHVLQKISKADPAAAQQIIEGARERDACEIRRRSMPLLPNTGIVSVMLNGLRTAYNEVVKIVLEPEIFDINSLGRHPSYSTSCYHLMEVSDNVIASMVSYVEKNPAIVPAAKLTDNDLQNLKREKRSAVWLAQPLEM